MKQVECVVKLILKVDEQIASCLDDQSKKANALYNKLIEHGNKAWKVYNETGSGGKILFDKYGFRNLVPALKEEFPYLRSVYSSVLKNAGLQVTAAFKAYFNSRNGTRKGKKIGWPRFGSWKAHWFSLLYDEPNKGFKIKGSILQLSLGTGGDRKRHFLEIPLIGTDALKGKTIRNLRIVKEHGIFSAVFTVFRMIPEKKPIHKQIVLDPNHKNFFYGLDNSGCAFEFKCPDFLRIIDRRIDEIKSKLTRYKKKRRRCIM